MNNEKIKFYYIDGFVTDFMKAETALNWLQMNDENIKNIKAVEVNTKMTVKEFNEYNKSEIWITLAKELVK